MIKNRIIVITGASGGIAQELIKHFSKDDDVILLGRNQAKLEKLYKHVVRKTCIGIDISDECAIHDVIGKIYLQYGKIDILINNAGFGEFKPYNRFSDQEIHEMFKVNTLATIYFSKLIAERMVDQGQGHIVNIASMAGLIASSKSTIYSATKFAVIGFSNALRLELANKNVYVTTVNPGPVETTFFDKADPSGKYLKNVQQYSLKPDYVAKRIVKILGKNKRELNLPFKLVMAYKFYNLFPNLSDKIANRFFNLK